MHLYAVEVESQISKARTIDFNYLGVRLTALTRLPCAERSESFSSIDSASAGHRTGTRALEAYPDQKVTR